MRKIQKGTILSQTPDTFRIYVRHSDFFTIKKENELWTRYVICKEPTEELIAEIEDYYAEIKRRNQKHDEFVASVAAEVYSGLREEDKAYIYNHPSSGEYHFNLGLMIRNKYIHGKELNFDYLMADELSGEIVAYIASMIIENYDYENLFYRYLYEDDIFTRLRRLYRAITGTYPDDILARYAELPDDEAAAKKAETKVRRTVLDKSRFESLCRKYGVREKQYREYIAFTEEYNKKNWEVIPYDIGVLTSKTLEPAERCRFLGILEEVLKSDSSLVMHIPRSVFNQRDAVLLAVARSGTSLKRFERFNGDDEIIRAALKNNGEAIQYVRKDLRGNSEYLRLALSSEDGTPLKMRCMIPYRDDDELVKIALEVNGRNIQWASTRIRDDFEMAAFAVRHQKEWYPESTICNLSFRLRDNLDIALIDIREGHGCVGDYSLRLRNSDEVAEALLQTEHAWKMYEMSKRIQKKYGKS